MQLPETIQSYVVKEGGGFELKKLKPKELGPEDVCIKIEACGLCHSDFFYFKKPGYVPGHEIVGEIVAKGSAVHGLEKGDRVGVGWQGDSCQVCEQCLDGWENYCPHLQTVIQKESGGYSDYVITSRHFTFLIPSSLDSKEAAPLLCGGATVFSALKRAKLMPGMRVAIVGIGGLGHLAIQFARAWGCSVVAITRCQDKEKHIKDLGACETLSYDDLEKYFGTFDVILNCRAKGSNEDVQSFFKLLKPRGVLAMVGYTQQELSIPLATLNLEGKRVIGNLISPPSQIRHMLKFASLHKVRPWIETMPMNKLEEAIQKVEKNEVRYRVVLTPSF